MIVFPHCKVNLGLNITEKRSDGYHNLESVFLPVPWTDALEMVRSDKQGLTFHSSGLLIPGDSSNNLVIKAYNLLAQNYQVPGLAVHLHKVIPMGAGLGGGSSDGAFALHLINELAGLQLNKSELAAYAVRLGSDCPFFLNREAMMAGGRGEILEPFPLDLKNWYMLIVMPPVSVGTAEAYSWIKPKPPRVPLRSVLLQDPAEWKDALVNDFEEPVMARYPVIGEMKEQLYRQGAVYASMSGSGAAVFGLFRNEPDRNRWKDFTSWSGRL
ncbi:MAG: 4-(cytidine 5'-diphospho)-2-C-methyl-D-erythritol kinase [Bacteroidia bacterium]|nr:4-(cytidine 5'-diphospho)-2-C-methyl-D-erythritol kinase [Bacteroidia bacterium]